MDFSSKPERINSNPYSGCTGENIPQDKKEQIMEMTMQGKPVEAIKEATGISKPTIYALTRNESDKFDLTQWKRQTTNIMSQIVSKGSQRLLDEIDNIPAGQLPLTLAILTDKIMALQDAPTVVVEHRLRVSHDDINQMIKGDKVIDLPPSTPQDGA
jgi:hypothetical protein